MMVSSPEGSAFYAFKYVQHPPIMRKERREEGSKRGREWEKRVERPKAAHVVLLPRHLGPSFFFTTQLLQIAPVLCCLLLLTSSHHFSAIPRFLPICSPRTVAGSTHSCLYTVRFLTGVLPDFAHHCPPVASGTPSGFLWPLLLGLQCRLFPNIGPLKLGALRLALYFLLGKFHSLPWH